MIALAGVVVDHVQDHFDALAVQRAHHAFKLGHLLARRAAARVARLGAKKPIEL